MKVSVIIRCRNEYPIVLGTVHALQEDLEWCGLDYEFIVVDNLSTDDVADVLEDRYRRWVRNGLLKVVRYDEKASTWCAINAGFEQAQGNVIMVCDAHITVKTGTTRLLAQNAHERGGIWHAPLQMWGDTETIMRYGHDLKLCEKFWGDPCPYKPPGQDGTEPWKIPMAGACLFAVHRDEVDMFDLYDKAFRAYGGGEPYLCLKWWMAGSAVWIHPQALCRHAFGIKAEWATSPRDKTARNSVLLKNGEFSKELKKGDQYVRYVPGYTVSNEDHYFNFMLAAYLIGGNRWLGLMTEQFRQRFRDPLFVDALHEQVLEDVEDGRGWVESISKRSLDDLLLNPPWEQCDLHKVQLPSWLAS